MPKECNRCFEDDNRIRIGETPWTVWVPGAGRDEVKQYALRIKTAWQSFIDLDMVPASPKLDTPEKTALYAKVSADINAFRVYRETIIEASFWDNPLGVTPQAAWQALIQYESVYKTDCALWAKAFGSSSCSTASLEVEGGIKQPNPLDGAAAAASKVLVPVAVAAVAIAALFLLPSMKGLSPASSPKK